MGISITKIVPMLRSNVKILKNVFTSSTCSVVKDPPYFALAKSILEGLMSVLSHLLLGSQGIIISATNSNTY